LRKERRQESTKKEYISGIWLLGQQVHGAGIVDVSDIANIAGVADIVLDIADIVTDIADIASIADIVNIADIADRMLRILRWKQVGVYKVSRECPVTLLYHLDYYYPYLATFILLGA